MMTAHIDTNATAEIFCDKSFSRKTSGMIRIAAMAFETKLDMDGV